jgi:hypothetical protein
VLETREFEKNLGERGAGRLTQGTGPSVDPAKAPAAGAYRSALSRASARWGSRLSM